MASSTERTPEENARNAAVWAKQHPVEWSRLLGVFRSLPRRGVPFTRDSVYTELAKIKTEVTEDGEFARDHNMYAVLLRYACMLWPSIKERVRLRKSAYDDLDLKAIWEEFHGA